MRTFQVFKNSAQSSEIYTTDPGSNVERQHNLNVSGELQKSNLRHTRRLQEKRTLSQKQRDASKQCNLLPNKTHLQVLAQVTRVRYIKESLPISLSTRAS